MGDEKDVKEHKESQEQKLKKRFKFNFQTRNKTRLCNSKTRIKNKNMRCAKQI
jgi:hypothetical protein